jgi:hypothetical protein
MEQGLKLNDPNVAFADVTKSVLPFLRASTTGLLLMLAANLLFAANLFALTLKWKIALAKTAFAAVTAPLEKPEVEA